MSNLKEKILSSFLAFENEKDIDSYVHSIRSKAIKKFESEGFPTKKLESWKYTSLKRTLKYDYKLFPSQKDIIDFKDIQDYLINDIESYKIVFVNGKYYSNLSETTHEGMDICILSSALTQSKYDLIIENYFDRISKKDGITSLNTAFSHEGAYIHIPKNIQVDKPIQILHFSTGENESLMFQPRNLIVVDENSQVEIIERYQSITNNNVLVNSVSEIYVNKKSNVKHYKIQNDKKSSSLIDNTFVSQEHSSSYNLHTFSFGGDLTRNNLNVFQNDQRIESTVNGITIIDDEQHVDHNTLIHHKEPNCTSHQDYKGIYGGQSVGVFNGRVLVEKEAQKTNAFQANNNVLISDKASINTKPQLEIFADDVRCSHGCTIGQLDNNALFYLRSRGIPEKEATALMMFGFANKVLTSVQNQEIKSMINKIIASKLAVKIGFDL